jgi:hypothetical protein
MAKVRPVMGLFDENENLVQLLASNWRTGDGEDLLPSVRTASGALVLLDAGRLVAMNVAGANTLTIPPFGDVALPVGTIIPVTQDGAGQTTIVAGVGVTINRPASRSLAIAERYETVYLHCRALNLWQVSGALAEA